MNGVVIAVVMRLFVHPSVYPLQSVFYEIAKCSVMQILNVA